MARTNVPTTNVLRAGALMTATAVSVTAANGAKFRNTGREWICITNASGSSSTITATTPKTVDGLAVADKTWTVATGTSLHLPPFPSDTYNNADDQVYLDTTQTVSMTCYRDGA